MAVPVVDKATGKEVRLDPGRAQQALLEGHAVLPQGRVLIRRNNEIGEIDAETLSSWVDSGWSLSDEDEHRQIKLRREESDAASTAAGAIEAAASGLTFGISRKVQEWTGADMERMRARAEGLGAAEDVIEMGAALLPIVFSGGTGAAVKGASMAGRAARVGAKVAGAPVRAVARAGEATEAVLARALARAPTAVRRAIPMAGRGAVEGYAYGVGAEIDESVLGEREITAERLMAAGFTGGLLGAGGEMALRIGLPAIASGASKVAVEPVRRVLGRMSGIEGGGSSRIADALGKTWKALGAPEEPVSRVLAKMKTKHGRGEIGRALEDSKGAVAEMAKDFAGDLDAVRTAIGEARIASSGARKLRRVSELVPEHADDWGRRIAAGLVDPENPQSLRAKIAGIAAKNERHRGHFVEGPVFEDIENAAESALQAMRDKPTGAGAFEALDDLKRTVGEELADARRAFRRTGQKKDKNTRDALEEIYDEVRTTLRREDAWGAAGKMQAEIDAAASSAIITREAFAKGPSTASKRLTDGYTPISDQDALRFIRHHGRDGSDTAASQLDAWLDAEVGYLETVKRHYELPPEVNKQITDAIERRAAMRETMRRRGDLAADLDDLEHLRSWEGNRSVSIGAATTMGPAAGAAIGAAVGGGLGAIPGALLGRSVTSPYTTVRMLAGLSRTAESVERATRDAVQRFARGTPRPRALKPAAAQLGRVGARTTAERFKEVQRRVGNYSADPLSVARGMDRDLRLIDDVAPNLGSTMREHGARAVHYLREHLPPVYVMPLASDEDALVDPLQMRAFLRRVDTVERPALALDALEDGTITIEHAETLREVYPAIYADVQRQIVDALAEDRAAGKRWPLQRRATLGVLFGLPLDPTLQYGALATGEAGAQALAAEESAQRPLRRSQGRHPQWAATGTQLAERPLSERYR